jgi:uncharacterized membrane protein YphA (DoxX/SURF4 family)
MNSLAVRRNVNSWAQDIWKSWDAFLFSPTDPATLGLIRILAGAMLLYTHFVWTLDLEGFFGAKAWLSNDFVHRYHDSPFGWSHLYWIDSNTILWVVHLLSLGVFACLMVGFRSRTASVLAFLLTVSYAHRAGGALFGLDQINGFLALYLMVGPCGNAFSVDSWLRRTSSRAMPGPSVSANIAIRLIQIHLCIVYLFAGLGKLLGESWWDGTALWGALANQEYQTLDMTWMAGSIVFINIITHVTLVWEVSYSVLIWNRLTRPVMLLLAIPLHMGIAICMGMVTFGLVMLIANLAFIPPEFVRSFAHWCVPSRTSLSNPRPPHIETSRARRRVKNANS